MYRLHCFGYPKLESPGGESLGEIERSPKRFGLLIYLACRRGSPCAQRETLLPVFWPDASDDQARNALRQSLFWLRKMLGPEVILGRDEGEVALNPDRFACDLWDFRRQLREGISLVGGHLSPRSFLRDFTVRDAEPFMDWVHQTRHGLLMGAIEALTRTAGDAEESGRSVLAYEAWRRALEWSPHSERLLRNVVTSAVASGDRAAAAEVWTYFQTRLQDDLGLQPTTTTRRIVHNAFGLPDPGSVHPRSSPRSGATPLRGWEGRVHARRMHSDPPGSPRPQG